ncbi:hypothetical protein BB559_006159 [Furculomyces boomerangus]|uniref:Probable quinone oxidoreductase n=2 Tax=Harpellales TaxID=61421 RepID=A0A2T9Y471_9FUNG|nr:hypothetical protein BB559_006159 [Furculomyces boomerangus]PWA03200.1 hypothetical protein BB558_000636 [Smittium angustum]
MFAVKSARNFLRPLSKSYSTMKAIQVSKTGDVSVLEYTDVKKPEINPDTILVKNLYSGVNFIDTYFRTGLYPTPLPTLLGREGSGIVEQVGQNVSGFSVGDTVAYLANNCTYAEYSLAEPKSTYKVPSGVSPDIACASLLQGLTALTLVTRSYAVKKDDTILVHAAAGGTGRLVVQLCKYYGAKVIGTTSSEEKAEIAKSVGCDHIIYYTKEDVATRVAEITNGKNVDAVFDGVGKSTFQSSFDSLKLCGTLVSFGNASGKVPPIEINILSKKNLVLLRPMLFGYISTKQEFDHYTGILFDLIAKKVLDISICGTFDLKQAGEAHTFLEARKSTGKVILKI